VAKVYSALHQIPIESFFAGKTENEVMRKAADHARTSHNMTEISKELQEKVRSAIRDVEKC
jgi:predicted small metal-binding protein